MSKILLSVFMVVFVGLTNAVHAQDAQQKTQDLIAALAKTKYKKKEKKNIKTESYLDIKSEAVIKNDPAEYSGTYQSSDGNYDLKLFVKSGNEIEGGGFDTDFRNSERRDFTLREARIEGALLTATKVFSNGTTEKLEAVFNNRTVVSGKNPNEIESRETKYGLGFIQSYDENFNRVFLENK